jgi:hypothetical protein
MRYKPLAANIQSSSTFTRSIRPRLVRMNADAAVNLDHWNAIAIRQFTLLLANR